LIFRCKFLNLGVALMKTGAVSSADYADITY
jgi:hypothetical protein